MVGQVGARCDGARASGQDIAAGQAGTASGGEGSVSDYDVIVIGAGAAGLSAAVSAAEGGASVLLLEADARCGGSSRLSGGHIYAAGTSLQREAGIVDDADAMFEHYMTLNQFLVEASVVRRYCDLSASAFEWLRELGVHFPAAGLYRSGVGSVPRGHQPEGAGAAIVEALEGRASALRIDQVLNCRASGLLRDDAGAIRGVRAPDGDVTAPAVVIASGGFGANPELLARHYPSAARNGDWCWYIGSPMAQGDALALGASVGAALDGHDRGLILASPGFSRDLEVALPNWLILVNDRGRRFTDETVSYTVLAGLMQHQGGRIFAVFDEAARANAKRSPQFNAYWVNEVLERKAEEGVILRADSLAALAAAAGMPAETLAGTVERYNRDCDAGHDSVFFKKSAAPLPALRTAPFYAVEVRPAIICWTGCGLRVDADVRVLDVNERVIPGLFAAGEAVGSLHGDRYIGGGGSFGPCVTLGRLAGQNATTYVQSQGMRSQGAR
jgi:fumarate reductase flavoprotein subunit